MCSDKFTRCVPRVFLSVLKCSAISLLVMDSQGWGYSQGRMVLGDGSLGPPLGTCRQWHLLPAQTQGHGGGKGGAWLHPGTPGASAAAGLVHLRCALGPRGPFRGNSVDLPGSMWSHGWLCTCSSPLQEMRWYKFLRSLQLFCPRKSPSPCLLRTRGAAAHPRTDHFEVANRFPDASWSC